MSRMNGKKTHTHTTLLYTTTSVVIAVPIEKPETLRVRRCRCYMPLGAMLDQPVCDPGGYRMGRGWRYTKLSLSSALLRVARVLPFVLLFAIDVSIHRFFFFFLWIPCPSLHPTYTTVYYTILSSLALFVFVVVFTLFLFCFYALVGALRCPSDLFLSSRPRTGWATNRI